MALQFTAANSEYLTNATTPVTAAPFTVAGWVFLDSVSASSRDIFHISDSAGTANLWQLVSVNSDINFQVKATSAATASVSGGITVSTWHFVAGRETSSSSRHAFVDTTKSTENTTDLTPASIDRLYIGATAHSVPGLQPFDGQMAELGVWDVALTDVELGILALGAAPITVRPASLVAYWPLNESASPSIDLVGGRDEAWVNTPTLGNHPRVFYPPRRRIISVTAAGGADPAASGQLTTLGVG